jgi:hypothetical protein
MPPYGPICRRDLNAALRDAGFAGPYLKGHHEAMIRGSTSFGSNSKRAS